MSQDDQSKQSDAPSDPSQPPRSSLEWVTFSIASVVLAGVVGLVGFVWVTKSAEPPIVTITAKEPLQDANGQFYLPFEVINTGGETATSVQVMAELQIGDQVEVGDQQIDFLSVGETEEGAFVFSQNPEQGTLTLRVASYALP